MPIWDKIFGSAGRGLASPIEAVGNVIDKVWTSDEERLSKKEAMARINLKASTVQAEINKIEAQHRSIFVAGWRPFIGWVCGSALAYNFIVRDLLAWAIVVGEAGITAPPELGMGPLITILGGLLGLGTLRTREKLKGAAK